MKQSKYISKYDYIGYHTKQKNIWFYTNSEIQTGLDIQNKMFDIQGNFDEIRESNTEEEFDIYEYYSEIKESNKDLDLNNPLIIEGNIIDKLSKEKIKEEYQIRKVYDFDNDNYKYLKMEELAIITKKILLEEKNVIIFQPVFILNNLITKSDALVKLDKKIEIIETKGTTTTKSHHLLDLLFQKNVINNQDFLNDYSMEYKLCVVEYKLMNKNEIDFVITPYCNISKTVTLSSKIKDDDYISFEEKIELKGRIKIGEWYIGNNTDQIYPINITRIINDDWSDFQKRYTAVSNHNTINQIHKFKTIFGSVLSNFQKHINELWEHKKEMKNNEYPKVFEPSTNDNGFFKQNELWYQLKDLYGKNGYDLFKYSGYIFKQNEDTISKYITHNKHDIEEYIRNDRYKEIFLEKKNMNINKTKCFNEFNKIKKNKVYLDFESINTAIRNVDNSLPFNQIVTQCSIIKWYEKEDINNLICNNLIIDPLEINKEWFMKIIDRIYDKSDCSYIVYNKSFEASRLKDMKMFINKENYSLKINNIINNLYDLADFFDPRKDMILIKELCGFYSIKKIIPLIEKYNIEFLKQTGSKNYKELKIGNGLLCQKETTLRFFNKINLDEWNNIAHDLKLYCENDVRCMIAVELFIKHIIKNKKLEK